MEKLDIEKQTQENMTYFRQGISSETQALTNMQQFEYSNAITLNDRKHDIKNFISRPIDVYKGLWTTDQNQGAELIPQGILFPNVFLANNQYQEKVRGFVALKGFLNIRILVNPQKFQQGKLIAYYIPNYLNLTTKAKMIQKSLSGRSGCPCAYINCEGGTATTMRIPYVNQHTFYNLVTNQGNFGALFLAVLLPLKSITSGDTLGIRIQAWMDDTELQFPTAVMPVLTQGFEEEKIHPVTANPDDSSASLKLSDIVSNLENFEFKPSYLAKTAGNLFQLAGYQKPVNTTAIERSHLMTAAYMANSNGEFMGHKLSLSAANEIPPCASEAGSTTDEMNIQHIAQIPTYYRTFNVDTTMDQNTVVWIDNVHPAKFSPSGTEGVLDSTMVGYVSAPFAQWRGKMTYTFHVAKTMFHSCTLRATFVPYLYAPFPNANKVPDGIDLDRCYQQTFDLKDKNEFSVTCEQCVTRPYLNLVNPFSIIEQSVSKRNYSPGVLIIDVFLPLRVTETVTQNIDIAVFVSGGPDIEFANPSAPIIYPYYDSTQTVVANEEERVFKTVKTQGLGTDEQHDRYNTSNSTEQFSSSNHNDTPMASALCTGELVTSIKSLMGRFGTYAISDQLASDTLLHIAPFDFQIPLTRAEVTDRSPKEFDFIDYFSFLFAFYKGQVHLIIDPGFDGVVNNNTMHCLMRSSLSNYFPTGNIPRASTSLAVTVKKQFYSSPFPKTIIKPSLEGLVSLNSPNYSLTHILPVLVEEQDENSIEESKYPFPIITLYNYKIKDTNKWSPTIFRACHDDFRFHYLLGPPQVHFLDYEFAPANQPLQYSDVIYSNSSVTRVGQEARGLFGINLSFANYTQQTAFFAPNQFLAINLGANNKIYLLPEDAYSASWLSNQILITKSNFVQLGDRITFLNNAPSITGNLSAFFLNYSILNALTGSQATPFPASTVALESVSVNTTSLTMNVPSWNKTINIASNSPYFNLPKPLLIATSGALPRQYILLASNTLVQFRLSEAQNSINVFIETQQIGTLISSLGASTGFLDGVPTYCPTLVDAR